MPKKSGRCPTCNDTRGVDLKGKPNDFGLACPTCCKWYYQHKKGQQFWLITVWGDVEPSLAGPYKTSAKRDREALLLKHKEGDRNGIYWMDTAKGKHPDIGSYSGGFMELAKQMEES